MGSTENGYPARRERRGACAGRHGEIRAAFRHPRRLRAQGAGGAESPSSSNRFLKGFFAAIAYIKTHKDETTAIAVPLQNESAAVLNKAWEHEGPMMVLDGEFDPQGLALIKDSFIEMGILDKKPSDDEILTRRFLPVKP